MFQFMFFIFHSFTVIIAHPLASEFEYLSFSLLPDETLPEFTSSDGSSNPEPDLFDLYDDDPLNDWETSSSSNPSALSAFYSDPADSIELNLFAWEPLVPNAPIPSVSSLIDTETLGANENDFQPLQFSELGISPTSSYAGSLCARDAATPENGAVCSMAPQCDFGRKPMCCSKVTEHGRPTECTKCEFLICFATEVLSSKPNKSINHRRPFRV